MNRQPSISIYTIVAFLLALLSSCAGAPQVKNITDVTEDEVRSAYEIYAKNWSGNEYSVRHIIVERHDESVAALKRIQAGESFAQVAAAVSTDPGSRDLGGELGWCIPAYFVPEFSQAMVALAPKGLTSEPVKTRFGWHIIEVTAVRSAVPPPFDQVKEKLAEKLRQSKARSSISP